MIDFIVANKPFRMLSQFTTKDNKLTLSRLGLPKGYYVAGRLDWDSEGLLILTNNGRLQARLASPAFHLPKTYWVQVEGTPTSAALQSLQAGLLLKDGRTRRATASLIDAPDIWTRTPPIRQRQHQPTSWLSITLTEGKNRQARRMTAAIGHPTLRLIRAAIGHWQLDQLQPGEWRWEKIALPIASKDKRRTKS